MFLAAVPSRWVNKTTEWNKSWKWSGKCPTSMTGFICPLGERENLASMTSCDYWFPFFFCFIGNDRHRLVTLSAMWTRNWSRSHDTGRSHLFNESKCAAWPRFTTLLLQFTYSIQRNCILLGQVLLLIILPDTTLRHFGIVMCLRMYSDSHIFVFCAQLGQTMSTSNEINWFYTLHVTLIRNQRVPELKCFSLSTDTGSTQLMKWADPYKSNWWFRLA